MKIITLGILFTFCTKAFGTGIPLDRAPEFMNIDEGFDPCITQTTDTWMCYQGNAFRCETVSSNNGEIGNTYAWLDCSRHSLACASGRCNFGTNICQNGATYRASECECIGSWIGVACDICGKDSSTCSSGRVDESTCECECDGKCANDGTMYGDCFCNCPLYCQNGDRNADCSCTCNDYWTGDLCEICSLSDSDCGIGGYVDENCQCVCGLECNKETTVNQTDFCECNCLGGWSGLECRECNIHHDNCTNNKIYNEETCDCECQTDCFWDNTQSYGHNCTCSCAGNWSGELCDECSLHPDDAPEDYSLFPNMCVYTCNLPCENALGIDKDSCTCSCQEGWRGKLCNERINDPSNMMTLPFWAFYVIGGGAFILVISAIWCACSAREPVKNTKTSDWKRRNQSFV